MPRASASAASPRAPDRAPRSHRGHRRRAAGAALSSLLHQQQHVRLFGSQLSCPFGRARALLISRCLERELDAIGLLGSVGMGPFARHDPGNDMAAICDPDFCDFEHALTIHAQADRIAGSILSAGPKCTSSLLNKLLSNRRNARRQHAGDGAAARVLELHGPRRSSRYATTCRDDLPRRTDAEASSRGSRRDLGRAGSLSCCPVQPRDFFKIFECGPTRH